MAEVDLEYARCVAVRAVEQAGALLVAGAGRDFDTRAKNATGDLVTSLDLAAEDLIVRQLRAAFPQHRILSEEAGLLDAADQRCLWLVDPLDGTNNLAVGLNAYAVGVALCLDRMPVLGVVHDPVRGQTWSAVRGQGATGPAGRLSVPPYRPAAHGPVLAWVQGYGVPRDDGVAMGLRLVLESRARRVLQLWAPMLAWVMLARGDIDGVVGYRAEPVDLPAGSLIAHEAGAALRAFDGAPFDERVDGPAEHSFVAGHPLAVADLLGMVEAAAAVRVTGLS